MQYYLKEQILFSQNTILNLLGNVLRQETPKLVNNWALILASLETLWDQKERNVLISAQPNVHQDKKFVQEVDHIIQGVENLICVFLSKVSKYFENGTFCTKKRCIHYFLFK